MATNITDVRGAIIMMTLNSLFAPDERRMTVWADKLILMNNEAIEWKVPPNCFQHRGIQYRHSNLPMPFNMTKIGIPVLHRDLAPEIEKFITERETLSNDRRRIEQFLTVLIRPLEGTQQIRDALPDCLARHTKFGIPREFPQEMVWQLTHEQILEYRKLLPIIQMYDGSSLFL